MLLLYAQLHRWQFWMVRNLQYLIMVLMRVWGLKPTEDVLFHRFQYFFTWWSHANVHIAKAGRYVYYAVKFTSCQNFILKKTDLTGFFIIKPSHPDGLKKTISGRKKTAVGALVALRSGPLTGKCNASTWSEVTRMPHSRRSDMTSQCSDSAMADCRTLFASHSLTA